MPSQTWCMPMQITKIGVPLLLLFFLILTSPTLLYYERKQRMLHIYMQLMVFFLGNFRKCNNIGMNLPLLLYSFCMCPRPPAGAAPFPSTPTSLRPIPRSTSGKSVQIKQIWIHVLWWAPHNFFRFFSCCFINYSWKNNWWNTKIRMRYT